jgi:carbon monoxide dehydrogenase subunit G
VAGVGFTLEIDRSQREVFGYLTDVDCVEEWQPATEEIRRETEGQVGVGSRWTQVLRLMGRTIESRIEVTEHEPDSRFAIRTSGGPVNFHVVHVLEPLGEGRTRLRVEGEGEAGGLLKLGEGMVVRAAERELRRSFERLKAVLESSG